MLSLSGQTYRNYEVIFVDNASTDNSLDKPQRFLETSSFKEISVKTIINHSNLGYCAGNNVGLTSASGEYIIFLNNDTFVTSDWLENLVMALENDHSVGACQSTILFAQTKTVQSAGMLFDTYGWSLGISDKDNPVSSEKSFYPMGASVIVRRDLLGNNDGFDELVFSGDYDLGWRIRLLGYKVTVSNTSICYHYGGFATQALNNHPRQFYHSCKERIYVLSKNYSFSRLLFRIPPSLLLMFSASVTWSLIKKENYFISFFNALVWNFVNIKKILYKRSFIQKERKVSDKDIERFMTKYPLMFALYKRKNTATVNH
jgi:GT2 family glycosyltransferase